MSLSVLQSLVSVFIASMLSQVIIIVIDFMVLGINIYVLVKVRVRAHF